MARKPRILSDSGIYHIISRGIDKMSIFVDDYDCKYFLECLKSIAVDEEVEVHCYCLMGNHFHLLVKTKNHESPARFMKRINGKYAIYFNRKYDRIGPLFQGRFKSECVENDEYYMTVYRYILRNPVKAGICEDLFEYKWSSAMEILIGNADITTSPILTEDITKEDFISFLKEKSDVECEDINNTVKYASDRTAKRVCESKHVGHILMDVRVFDDDVKREVFKLLNSVNCSVRQISRLTGIPRGIIKRLSAA